MSQSLFLNPVFKEAVADVEALGLKVSDRPFAQAIPYAVIGGRSNARWWLVPLENSRVTASGLALFQPLLSSARLMKVFAVGLSRFGLSRLWVRNIIYISGESALQQFFTHVAPLSFAYFTGTDSPHRKLAVQVMDNAGNIKGYAKVSRNPSVHTLLLHEANTLNYVNTLNLQTANIPNVLFSGALGKAYALVTDTLKTPKTNSVTKLLPIHLDFLRELADKAKTDVQNNPDWLVEILRSRFAKLETRLTPEWKARLEKAIAVIEAQKEYPAQPVLAHGDFTPWNTFLADGKLYVFDWEYCVNQYPSSYDLIHFCISAQKSSALTFKQVTDHIKNALTKLDSLAKPYSVQLSIMSYICLHSMQYAERVSQQQSVIENWDDEPYAKGLIDELLQSINK